MSTKNILGIIFSVLFVAAFTFVLCWGIINFNKVKDGMSTTGLYTQDDIDASYNDGYNTALIDKESYDELINSYRDTITTQTDQISQLSSQVLALTNTNKDYVNQISSLDSQKSNLEMQVENLTSIKTENETLIAGLNIQIVDLQKEITLLENSNYNNRQEIAHKNSQIINLQNMVAQLQKTNELNVQTINNLNNQITGLNTQISELTIQIQNNSTNVTTLHSKIAELEKSVSYYEQYISNLENGEQVVATFEFNGSVYNIQIVNKYSILTVTDPQSTDYIVFNYWTVDGNKINLENYTITNNVKIVADVTYKYDVNYIVDENMYENQIVIKEGLPTLPNNPIKAGYEFDGWTINGVDIVDPTTISINQNTSYIAKFTKLHNVSFMYEDGTISSQSIRNGNFASNVSVDSNTYKIFNGWMVNGTMVDISNYKIVSDTIFVANITYYYDVEFIVDDSSINSQIVEYNNISALPEAPKKQGYVFIGWSLNGIDSIDVATYQVQGNTQFIALFERRVGWGEESFNVEAISRVNFEYFFDVDEDRTLLVHSNNASCYLFNHKTLELESNFTFVSECGAIDYSSGYIYGVNEYGTAYKMNVLTQQRTNMASRESLQAQGFKTNDGDIGCKVYKDKYLCVYGRGADSIFTVAIMDLSNNTYFKNFKLTSRFGGKYYDAIVIDDFFYVESYYMTTEYVHVINMETLTQVAVVDDADGIMPMKLGDKIYWYKAGITYLYDPYTNTFTEHNRNWNGSVYTFMVNGLLFNIQEVAYDTVSRKDIVFLNLETFAMAYEYDDEHASTYGKVQQIYALHVFAIDEYTLLIYSYDMNSGNGAFAYYYL